MSGRRQSRRRGSSAGGGGHGSGGHGSGGSSRADEKEMASLLFAEITGDVCFVTEILKIVRTQGWGRAMFHKLTTYLRKFRSQVSHVHLITRHSDEDGNPFQATTVARGLFEDLGFGAVQVCNTTECAKKQSMLYELFPGQTYMRVTVSHLHNATKCQTHAASLILKTSWRKSASSKWFERRAVVAIRREHRRIGDGVSVKDVIPRNDVICIYGIVVR